MKKNKEIGNSIFKYCSSKTAKLILSNNEVLLTKPNDFNDPYDSSLMFEDKDLEIARDVLLNYAADIALKKVLKEHYHQLPFIQKIIVLPATWTMKLSDYNNKRFKEYKPVLNYAKWIGLFTRLGLKNGKEESNSQKALDDFIDLKNSGKIEKSISKAVQEASATLSISCFSKIEDSVLMWSHYADNNKGICLEFENEGFLDVSYSEERTAIRIRKLMYKILWNFHTKEKIEISKKELPIFLIAIAPLLTKSKDWAYEKEVRCIFNSSNKQLISRNDQFFYRLKTLKSIILGCRTSEDEKAEILIFAKDNQIPIYQMQLSNNTYKLIKSEITQETRVSSKRKAQNHEDKKHNH